MAALLVAAGLAHAQDVPAPSGLGASAVAVDRFEFQYGLAHPQLPPLAEVGAITVPLKLADGVWQAAGAKEGQPVALDRLPAGSRFGIGALRAISEQVVRWFNARDIYGVWVAFTDLEASGSSIVDNRPAGDRTARLVIWASQIAEVRTLARGNRFKPRNSIDNPKHRRIIKDSPLRPGATPGQPGDLFRRDKLDDYLRELSLHPGRRVEASIASAGEPGKVVLDYLVNEVKPWQVFSQVTNTGTSATGMWRGRLGFQDNQLTNHDDILNLDAISTPDFHTYGTFLSYRLPLIQPAKLLARVYGSYGDFLANDPTLESLRFVGKNWLGGLEFSNRLALWRHWELMSTLGAEFDHFEVASKFSGTTFVKGSSNFLIPYLTESIGRDADWWALSGGLRIDDTVGSAANLDPTNGIAALGRLGADAQWTSLRWNLNGSVFLEPLFHGAARAGSSASEVAVRLKGRSLLRGKRLIPQEEEPMGGEFSVRGYPESILSADEFYDAQLEFAYHIPRVLRPGDSGRLFGRPFNWRPTRSQQHPDWDLIVRAFFDYGRRIVNPQPSAAGQSASGETALIDQNVNLAGAGGGLELDVRQNFSLRCDVGMALSGLRDNSRPAGQQVVVASGRIQAYLISSFSW